MRIRSLLCLLLVLAALPSLRAQRPKDGETFVCAKPTIGDKLPDLTVYDPSGKEIKLSSLKGHYTVLTFGCLT